MQINISDRNATILVITILGVGGAVAAPDTAANIVQTIGEFLTGVAG